MGALCYARAGQEGQQATIIADTPIAVAGRVRVAGAPAGARNLVILMADHDDSQQRKERRFPPEVILYLDGRFMSWSTKDKRPTIYNRRPSEFHMALTSAYGPYGGAMASARMRVAMQYGSSLGPSIRPEEILEGNHLGDNGEELGLAALFAQYVQDGLPDDLPMRFETLEMTKEAAERFDAWSHRMTNSELERHKRAMEDHGFPF